MASISTELTCQARYASAHIDVCKAFRSALRQRRTQAKAILRKCLWNYHMNELCFCADPLHGAGPQFVKFCKASVSMFQRFATSDTTLKPKPQSKPKYEPKPKRIVNISPPFFSFFYCPFVVGGHLRFFFFVLLLRFCKCPPPLFSSFLLSFCKCHPLFFVFSSVVVTISPICLLSFCIRFCESPPMFLSTTTKTST